MQTKELSVCVVDYNVYTSLATAVGIPDAIDLLDVNGLDALRPDDAFGIRMRGDVFLPRRPVIGVHGLALHMALLMRDKVLNLGIQEASRLLM